MENLPLWLLPLLPVFACVITAAFALTRRAEKIAPFVTLAATALSGVIALVHIPGANGAAPAHFAAEWLAVSPALRITLSVNLDPLSWTMVSVVCLVSLLVQIYSIGYMQVASDSRAAAGKYGQPTTKHETRNTKHEPGYARYFTYLSLFTASMLGLVVADNLFQLYVCWELVGICSYLLIGFWWSKRSAADAAKKAFVVTRFGDVGFLLGVLLLVSAAGSFQFDAVQQMVQRVAHGDLTSLPLVSAQAFLILAPLLLFCGAIGKSAQFPLHVWLPDAMEGPTPVSALIHAATMVAAGVYMVARLLPIFAASSIAMNVVLLVGSITALMAATIALVQTDIKKVMAYSTISQLGYMMLGLGAGSRTAGMFHLVTHAMFKALLFLAAGSVIHSLHHAANPNDLRSMGGLGRRMRATAITCGLGVLALAGFPGLSGFWSKDAILGAALENGSPVALFALIVGICVAALTAFYAARMWMLAFAGAPRSEAAEHAQESPAVMTAPLWILAVFSVGLGSYLSSGGRFAGFLLGAAAPAEPVHAWLIAVTTFAALGGMALGWRLYRTSNAASDPIERMPGYTLFVNLWYVEAFWNAVGAGGALAVGRAIAWFDRNVIDGAVNGIAAAFRSSGDTLRRAANGQAQAYAAVMMAGLVLAILALAVYQYRSDFRPPVIRTTSVKTSAAAASKSW